MLIKDLENVIKEENLSGANICNTTSLSPDQVVITQEEGKWKVYNTGERASLFGVVSCFDSEAEACEDFIKKLRLRKKCLELEKERWKKRNDSLKIYVSDRVMPIAYIEMVIGLMFAVIPTACFLFFKEYLFTEKDGLTFTGVELLVVATVLLFVGFAVIGSGNYKRGVCLHGFFAERDGHVYAFSINPDRISEGNLHGAGTISKLINGFNQMNNKAYYTERMDNLRKSTDDLYNEVNSILDNHYSSLYSYRDIDSSKFTVIERKALRDEYERLKVENRL